jgi:hypothetical protein
MHCNAPASTTATPTASRTAASSYELAPHHAARHS